MENGGDLNLLNDCQQTPLVFADKSLLREMNLMQGVTYVVDKNVMRASKGNLKEFLNIIQFWIL